MDYTKYLDITCKVINAVLNDQQIDLSNYLNDKLFLKIMKEQTFLPFLYKAYPNKQLKKYYYAACLTSEQFDEIGNMIKKLFKENNIDNIFLKGFYIRDIYPDRNIRQMGDIDILVREEEHQKVVDLLLSNGFTYMKTSPHNIALKYKSFEIEIHNHLISEWETLGQYFKKPFDDALKDDEGNYYFSDTYNFLYLLAHYIKHLKIGAGLREVCDFYLLLKNKIIDIKFIRDALRKNNCEQFLDTLLTEINFIFGFNQIPYTPNEHYLELIGYSLKSGIHGFGEDNMPAKNEFINSNESKFKFMLRKLFIPTKKIKEIYPWSKFFLLLPFAYLCRLIYLLTKKKREIKFIINNKNINNDFFSNIGIKM